MDQEQIAKKLAALKEQLKKKERKLNKLERIASAKDHVRQKIKEHENVADSHHEYGNEDTEGKINSQAKHKESNKYGEDHIWNTNLIAAAGDRDGDEESPSITNSRADTCSCSEDKELDIIDTKESVSDKGFTMEHSTDRVPAVINSEVDNRLSSCQSSIDSQQSSGVDFSEDFADENNIKIHRRLSLRKKHRKDKKSHDYAHLASAVKTPGEVFKHVTHGHSEGTIQNSRGCSISKSSPMKQGMSSSDKSSPETEPGEIYGTSDNSPPPDLRKTSVKKTDKSHFSSLSQQKEIRNLDSDKTCSPLIESTDSYPSSLSDGFSPRISRKRKRISQKCDKTEQEERKSARIPSSVCSGPVVSSPVAGNLTSSHEPLLISSVFQHLIEEGRKDNFVADFVLDNHDFSVLLASKGQVASSTDEDDSLRIDDHNQSSVDELDNSLEYQKDISHNSPSQQEGESETDEERIIMYIPLVMSNTKNVTSEKYSFKCGFKLPCSGEIRNLKCLTIDRSGTKYEYAAINTSSFFGIYFSSSNSSWKCVLQINYVTGQYIEKLYVIPSEIYGIFLVHGIYNEEDQVKVVICDPTKGSPHYMRSIQHSLMCDHVVPLSETDIIMCSSNDGQSVIEKYSILEDHSSLSWRMAFTSVKDQITSMAGVDHLPSALIGLSTHNIYIWNHMRGSLLKCINSNGNIQRDVFLLKCFTMKGYIVMQCFSNTNDGDAGCLVAVNPSTDTVKKICRYQQPTNQNRLSWNGLMHVCTGGTVTSVLDKKSHLWSWNTFTGALIKSHLFTTQLFFHDNMSLLFSHETGCLHVYERGN